MYSLPLSNIQKNCFKIKHKITYCNLLNADVPRVGRQWAVYRRIIAHTCTILQTLYCKYPIRKYSNVLVYANEALKMLI